MRSKNQEGTMVMIIMLINTMTIAHTMTMKAIINKFLVHESRYNSLLVNLF